MDRVLAIPIIIKMSTTKSWIWCSNEASSSSISCVIYTHVRSSRRTTTPSATSSGSTFEISARSVAPHRRRFSVEIVKVQRRITSKCYSQRSSASEKETLAPTWRDRAAVGEWCCWRKLSALGRRRVRRFGGSQIWFQVLAFFFFPL